MTIIITDFQMLCPLCRGVITYRSTSPIVKCPHCQKEVLTPKGEEMRDTISSHPIYDPIAAPSHYLQTKISPLEVIEDWKLDFHLGSVIKYIGRHPHKGAPLEDLKKAQWYLARKIKIMEEAK